MQGSGRNIVKWSFSCVVRKYMTLALLLLLVMPSYSFAREGITISAAISLKDVFEEIRDIFESTHDDVTVYMNFGGTGALKRQIIGGAPVDVFASASLRDSKELSDGGFTLKTTEREIAGNSIVLIVPAGEEARVRSFKDLAGEDVRRLALGDPSGVPAGKYAEETLKHLNVFDAVKHKFIFTGNVRQVLDYVARGEVDAGIVYATDAIARSRDVRVVEYAFPESHTPVIYPVTIVKGTQCERLSREFITLLLSGQGQNVLKKYGFNISEGE